MQLYIIFHVTVMFYVIVTEFAKRDLIHASNFTTLMRHNVICEQAIKLKFSPVSTMMEKSSTKFQNYRLNTS